MAHDMVVPGGSGGDDVVDDTDTDDDSGTSNLGIEARAADPDNVALETMNKEEEAKDEHDEDNRV